MIEDSMLLVSCGCGEKIFWVGQRYVTNYQNSFIDSSQISKPPRFLFPSFAMHFPILYQQGTLRYLGMVTIILNDFPVLKYVLIGVMGLFVLTNKES